MMNLWEEHKGLVYWWSKKLKRIFGSAKSFDPNKGAFSTYFSRGLISETVKKFLRHESDMAAMRYAGKDKSIYNSDNLFYMLPERDESWFIDLIYLLGGPNNVWQFLMRELKPRYIEVIERRFKYHHTFKEIGVDMCISHQRVEQIQVRTLKLIQKRLAKLEVFNELFSQPPLQ